ncbi:fibrocystin isoform X6 [Mus pahari]|uniref:fibrocystin isoform X6 n=1 Tax=Mus pahari TaxID=10093 RepID=UPI001114DCD5|nr:fibrocystin isoform X6 [Mus pahari]
MMPAWLVSLLSMEVLLLAKPYSSFQIEPAEGSLAGGTWITVVFDGLDRSILYHNNGSQLEIDLVSVAIPTLRIPCDVSPVFLFADLPVVTCQTRSLSSEAHAGPYSVEISFGEQVLATPCPGSLDSCTFKFSKDQTPVLYQVFPASGVPGAVVHVYGRVITNWLETFDPDVDYIESPLILEAGGDKWLTPCSLINRQTGSCFPIQEEHGLGTVQCRVEGDYIGSQNVSFSVFNKGRSMVHKEAWLISAKQELFLYQTYPEILSVFPKVGSLGGRTDIIITGDFFDPSARVTIAGIPCDIRHVSPRKIECTTRAPGNEARLTAPQAGNRGLRFEVGDATKDEELTEATPGYRWQIVPNASSPSGFWSKEGRPFRARLSGFFVAPEINNYTFWIQADSQASLCFSSSEEPRTKVEVASVGVGTADWLDSWEQIRHEGSWHQKTAKLELQGGAKYYLEAEQHGIAPSRGMRIGVQIHNTWLNPDVVNTYLLEKHQIRARAQRLPDIQVLNVSGKGNFFLTWGNVSSQPVPANATAQQIQTTIEELLMVKCNLEPLSARVLLRLGFEQGLEGSRSDGVLTSSTEPFCGRFSLGQLGHLTLIPEALDKGYQLDRYPYLCLAYRGHMNKTLGVTVSFLSGFQNITKNITCDWNLTDLHPESWQFTCINLWDTCVRHSEDLQSSLANTPLLVHRIDIRPMVPEAGLLYVDEIILADTNVTVSQADSGIPCPGGNVVESVSVVGVPPVYTIASWLAGCGSELPLITACYVSTEETGDGSELVEVTAQRLQRTSPPLGGHFFLYLSDTVIPDVPVHMSARQLHKLLQDSADESTSGYVNAGDFTVTEDLNSCYEHVWTLSWTTQIGDLPNFIRVSDQNLTGVSPAVTARVVHDGGVFLGPIFGDMLATANQQTQVAVQVNDIPAYCSGSCSFQYQQESTPSVDHVCYSLGNDVSLLVHFTGTGFPRDPQFLQVTVNKTSCEVIFSNETNVACELALLPVGEHRIFMLVIPSGLAVNASGEDLFLHVEPRLDAVEPSTAAEIGGQWVTLRGSSLEGVSLVLFGTQSCIIDVIRSNSQQIQCKVPPKGKDGYTVNVTVISGDHSTVLDRAFTYVSSLNPVIVSLSRNRSNIAGGEILFLGMSLLVNYTDLDVQIYVQDASSQVLSQTVWGLEVVLPPLVPGIHAISAFINGVSIHSQGVDLHIQYLTEVFSVEPCSGSLLGGTLLGLSGTGLGRDPALIRVLVDSHPCDIVNVTEVNIWCETPPAVLPPRADVLTVPASVEIWAGNTSFFHGPSLVGKGFTFTYEAATTPVVTAMWGEFRNNSVRFYVKGNNISDSVILLGSLKCDLEVQVFGDHMNLSGCSFPLHSLEARVYTLQVRHKRMGFANMSVVPQKFELSPQIIAIFPTHGSKCGGTILTVKGMAFSSRRRSVHVDISGPFACMILSLEDHTVLCQTSFVGDQFSESSLALNITVLVNGLTSKCEGNCTFFIEEAATPIVDALTISISGSLTMVLMRGRRLGTTADEPIAFVDDQLPCHTTFFNTSHVACQIRDLAPGFHYLSAVHTSAGYACLNSVSRNFFIVPQVLDYFPKDFSIHGGSLLTIKATVLRGWKATVVYVGRQVCLTANISSEFIQCIVPAGNGSAALEVDVDGVLYHIGFVDYSSIFTPELLSVSQSKDILTFTVARISGAANVDIFIGTSPCLGVAGNRTVLQCMVPLLPAGEYLVTGYDHSRGWASSTLILVLRATVTSVTGNYGCLGGRLLHVLGAGFSPGNISAAVCGAPCQVLANATVSAFSCLVLPLDVSLAFLCNLRHAEDSCQVRSPTYLQCDLTISMGTERLPGSWPYIYLCEESSLILFEPNHWAESVSPSFSGLFLSPKVERDEVLIYNSSCNITMETEAEMECETPKQPITTKITEIQKSWGQNTQGNFSFQFCRRWSRPHSWFSQRVPHDGDSVTVETGHLLLLDANTSFLNALHIKGGKLIFMEPGPIELRAHSILITDGGELRIGSEDKPFQGKAQIKIYGSVHSTPFFPYGVKFLAVRNGTLSLHGSVPEVTVTYLQAAAHAGDTVLALGEAVDWHPGDEVVITSGMTVEGAEATEEVVVVETVRNADLHLRNPLRYSYNFRENWVAGENHILKATVALLSRNIIIQGNLTLERAKLLNSCQEANTAEGNLKHCLYSKSEKMLGARDLGARVIIQSFPEEPSLVKLKGLQFRNLGQAFHKHLSSLTLVGAMRGSYLQSCSVWDSFSRGLSMHRTWGLKVDSNIFYKIVGHAMLLGATLVHSFQSSFFPVLHGFCTSLPCLSMTVAHVEHSLSRTPPGSYLDRRFSTSENVTGRKNGWWEQGSTIRNNVIISVSGAEGLSSSEMLAPAGIYTFSPTNVIEGNRVCAAGYGYVFHLVTSQTLQAPLLSFNRNTAHSCTRYGLLVYPKFQPPWNNETGFTLFQNFMVWGSTGGAQIFRSTNLHLKNFQVYACRDFGIDILESDVNTLITDSFLLGHFTHKGSLCMSAGIKTPQRWELTISNTTFVNFDLNCVAIRTCSGCSQGQGGFTVKTRQLKFVNSSNLVAFPFPHAAVLEDLDGSLSGKNGSHVLASMETLSDTCLTNASFSQIVSGSVCGEAVLFHRMSIALANSLNVPKNLTMTDSSNKTITVNYVEDTLSNYYGWIALLLDQETYLLQFEGPWMNRSLQYSATFDSFAPGNHLLIMHRDLPPYSDILLRCGSQVGQSLPSHPLPSQDRACDWFFNRQLRQLTYLVSGEGQVKVFLQLKHGAPPSVSASTSVPESASRWSFPETWQDVEKGWGGYNHTIPGPGDDVLILPRIGLRTFYILAKPSTMKLHLQLLNFLSPNFQPSLMQVCSTESGSRLILRGAWMKNLDKTVLVDTDLPVLRCLYVMGTLDFPVDRSNVLSVACLLIAGGELKVGTLENPLEKDQRLLIFLRASEGIFCDHFEGIHVDPGTIGVYGKLRLYSAYPKKSWVHLGADIAPGNEKIIVHNAVDWQPHDTIVLSSSSYEAHEAEVLTVKEVKGHHIRIYERLKHRHIGSAHIMEDGQQVHLAAEVGLLTRNIRIQPDSPCSGRLLVGSFRKSSGEDFSGVLQLLNVEIQNMGMPLYSSIEFTGVSAGSWVISSTVHQSCSVGIHASSSHGVILNDNVVFCTNGHGIDVEGQNYSLTNNLVILTMQSANSSPWVAGIKVNYAEDIILHGNVVAGSERLGFHVSGHGCSSEVLWSDNVVHSSLHGLHLYKKHESNNCTGVSGFMAFKNFDYGAMVQTENSVDIQNITLVDNTVGLLAITYVSSALLSSVSTVQITLRNSVIVATSSSFDCIHDRKAPQSANWTSADRAPSNPRGGRIGILWPVSASEPSGWPQEPWHKVRSSHSVPGIMKLQDVTFSGFVKSCYSNDLDVCILPNEYSTGVMFPITTERTRMLRIKDKNKFYFPLLQSSRDLVGTICPTLDCEYPRKYLFTDLDGRTLGLPPPVSVFPRTEEEWTGSFLNTGIWYWFLNSQEIYCISREEQKCTFRAVIQGFFCKETEHAVLILDNVDATWTIPKSHPLVSVTNGFVDTFSIVKDSDLCSPTSSLSTFYSILPTKQMTKVCFPDQTPRFLRFLLLGNRRASKLILAVFYNEIQSPHVFLDKSFIPPTPLESAFSLLAEPAGANYFDIMNNLLYVVLQGEEPVEIYSSISIHLALTVTFSVLEKGWERAMLESLTDFFQIDPNQIRLTLEMPGNKETLEVIANSEGKRNRNCPTVTCGGPSIRYGQRRPLMAEMTSLKTTPATTLETFSKVIVIEIGDLPNIRNSEPIQSLPSNRLQRLVNQVITAQQTGALENVLGMTVGALLVTQSKGVTGYRNASSLITRNLIFTRPSELSILVQPSDGEVGIELPIQPRLVFLDEKNERVETLGLPAEPWIISVSLEGASESMLKGCTQAETRDGYVTFSRLAVLISGSNWHLVFTVISPPAGTNFTARSKAFAVLPVASKERSTIILALSLCSVTSWVALSCLVCCWLKKNKTRNMRMKVMQGMQSQFPRHSMDGVSKRKVSRLAVPEERTATPAPKIPRITCVPGPLAQQLTLQEPGNWQEAQQQLLRYQLAGHNQLLLSRPDLRQERKQGQEPSQLDKGSDCTGLAQEKDTCVPTEAFYLHPAPPETIQ